jgi:tripartite-type tricarboxylate transporter receptor subunit TctC
MKRLSILIAALSAAAIAAGTASAQDYPSRTITLIVPQTAGGTTDTLARIFAPAMAKELGQEIVVENRPGAGNTIGIQLVAEAEPDGYTLGVGSASSLSLAPLTQPDLGYDPLADLEAVFNFADVANALLVNAELGPKTMQELVALASERPGELNYASGGIGTTSHFATAMFVSYAGIAEKTVHIPYEGGGKASVGLAAGESHFISGPYGGNMGGLIDAGKLTPLAVSGKKRVSAFPDVPTFAEAGMPEYSAVGWFGIVAPAGTPKEIIARLNAAGNAAAKSPEVFEVLAAQGIEPVANTAEEFAEQIRIDVESSKKLVDEGVVKLE